MEKELVEALKLAIKVLIIQEARLLRAEQACPSPFVIREMRRSIQESKHGVIALVRLMDPYERNLLIKRIIGQSAEEEIDQAIETRKTKCLRCTHVRYFDETGIGHIDLPCEPSEDVTCDGSTLTIGCENPPIQGASCEGFSERSNAVRLDEYITEVSFFYEVREKLDRFNEIWDYLTRE